MSLRPTPVDAYPTPTSETQAETERVLLAHSPSATEKQGQKSEGKQPDHSILQKNAHLQFLIRNLLQGFPARYISQDASQPWLLFWTLQACAVLGVGLDSGVKERFVFLKPLIDYFDCVYPTGPSKPCYTSKVLTVGFVVAQASPLICYPHMRRYVPWR